MPFVEHPLPLMDHAQGVVPQDHGLDGDAVFVEGGKFLAVHHDAAVPGDQYHRFVRFAQLAPRAAGRP